MDPFRAIVARIVAACLLLGPPAGLLKAALREAHELSPDYSHRVWAKSDGLPDAKVLDATQSRAGFLWVGTQRGLARFDGHEFKVFSRALVPGMDPDSVSSVGEDDAGNLWAMVSGVPYHWDGQELARKPWPDSAPPDFQSPYRIRSRRGHGITGVSRRFLVQQKAGEWGVLRLPGHLEGLGDDFLEDEEGQGWSGVTSLVRLDLDTGAGTVFKMPPALRSEGGPRYKICNLHQHPAGGLIVICASELVPHDAQVWHFDPRNQRWTLLLDGMSGARLDPQFSFLDREGRLWLPEAERGLWRIDFGGRNSGVQNGDKPQTLGPREVAILTIRWPVPTDHANCGFVDREGNIWVGSEKGGLHQFTPRQVQGVSTNEGLPDESVWCVLPGREDTLWAGTEDGLARIVPSRIQGAAINWTERIPGRGKPVVGSWKTSDGLVSGEVRALAMTPDDTLWIGTRSGLDLMRDGMLFHHRFKPHWPESDVYPLDPQLQTWNKIRTVYAEGTGTVWAGVVAGLHRIRSGQDLLIAATQRTTCDVRSILRARDGALWVGVDGAGLIRFPSSFADAPAWSEADLRGTPFNAVTENPFPQLTGTNATLWNAPGLFPRPNGQPRRNAEALLGTNRWFNTTNGLPSNHVWSLCEDDQGTLWAGTENGLVRITRSQGIEGRDVWHLVAFNESHGLPSPLVNGLVDDTQGSLWVAHEHGVYKVARADLNAVAARSMVRVNCASYDESDGMLSAESNGSMNGPVAARTPDGRLWFATTRGVLIIDPSHLQKSNHHLPSPIIDRVIADDTPVWGDGSPVPAQARKPSNIVLPPGRARVLEIHYTAPTFVGANAVRYRYQLEGYEKTWHHAGTRRVAYYTNLRPGRYQIRVQVEDHHRWTNAQVATLGLVLQPFYWQTTWWWVVCAGAAFGALSLMVGWRLREVRRTEALEAAAVVAKERIRIAQDLHDGLGSGLAQLRILASLAEREADNAESLRGHLHRITERAHTVADTLRDIIWVAKPQSATVRSVAERICQHAEQHLRPLGIECRFDIPLDLPEWSLGDARAQNLYYAAREALTNVLKHARATRVEINVRLINRSLKVQIRDDGCGYGASSDARLAPGGVPPESGLGVRGIRQRMEAVGGTAEWVASDGQGMMLLLAVPGVSGPA